MVDPIDNRTMARGYLNIAATYSIGADSSTRKAIVHLVRVLEYVLEQMDKNHPEGTVTHP